MKNSRFALFFRLAFFAALPLASIAAIAIDETPAHADELSDAQAYVQKQNNVIAALLKQPATRARDAQISATLDAYVDYDELTRRAFGEPCPTTRGCDSLWKKLTDAQRSEVTSLLKQLVEKNYKKNLIRTLDFDVSYKGAREGKAGENRVRTEAKNKTKPRDPSVQVDYVVRSAGGGTFKIVDIVTEGSSLTKNYFDQFARMWSKGYPYIVGKLQQKIAKHD
jgi:ABC-type transporter MlaC component